MNNLTALKAAAAAALAILAAAPASATGAMTCDAGPQAQWRSQEQLVQTLTRQGWQVRRTKIDGGCYEVYGTMPNGDRVEAYFHPVSFRQLLVSRRGEVIFRAPPEHSGH
ncbi:MAG TPA: PepSY domain-containing protein [Allosphingosinicella sp.]|nr:PepSY domain-containing protein [Allosphingosinicella sp.]